jgi:L-alanine-DL-glutamate epimerase-like enolase superfamily enzyme
MLDYLDYAGPILSEPIPTENGRTVISDRPGCGIAWDEEAIVTISSASASVMLVAPRRARP